MAATIPVTTVSREAAGLFDEAIGLSDAGDRAAGSLKLKAALELDPNFALAHAALVGGGTKEEDAVHLERARSLLQPLPKLERLWGELMVASESEAPAALAALEAEHSDDWRINLEIGGQALLRALVTAGGTARTDPMDPTAKPYVDATSAEELNAALAEISDQLATCSFTLSRLPADESEKDNTNLYLNGEPIPFDAQATKQNGWTWIDAERTSIELYGESCRAFKTNRHTSVVVEFGCPPVVVL